MVIVLLVALVSPFSWAFSPKHSSEDSVLAATTTISFQDGVSPTSSYTGTRDVMLSETDPNTNFGSDTQLGIDGNAGNDGAGQDRYVLLSWNLTAIPKFSSIQSATITLHFDETVDGHTSGNQYSVYAMKRDWSEYQATWNNNQTNSSWSLPGALSTNDRSVIIGSFVPSQGPEQTIVLNQSGVSTVQAWVDDPAKNYGLIIASPTNSDGADFLSRETTRQTDRPKLTVGYQPVVSISKPPENFTGNSLFRDQGVSSAGVQATVYRTEYTFAIVPITLQLNKTMRLEGSVVDIYRFDLNAFDRDSNIFYYITNPAGERSSSVTITPAMLNNYKTGFPFIYGMGRPSGTYTVTFAQGNLNASAQFTVPERNKPAMAIYPNCTARGQPFTLYLAGIPKGTPLDIYRHDHDKTSTLTRTSYWDYSNSIPAPSVNERGEAIYILYTLKEDPSDRYLILARNQNIEVRFELPC